MTFTCMAAYPKTDQENKKAIVKTVELDRTEVFINIERPIHRVSVTPRSN